MKTLIIILLSFVVNQHTLAENLSGQNEPEFQRAVSSWLNNNDIESLTTLAHLAVDGNQAARLLLAGIERTERAPSDYLLGLSAKHRHLIFRSKPTSGNIFPSWLLIESRNGNSLAQALLDSGSPDVDLDTIKTLIQYGEYQATDHLVRIGALYGTSEIHKQLIENLALPELRPYVISQSRQWKKLADGVEALRYIQAEFTDETRHINLDNPDTREAALFLSLGTPFGNLNQSNKWYSIISRWIFSDEATKPIAGICNEKCPAESNSCALIILGLTGGYYEVIRQDTPLESIIPQSVFVETPRAKSQALRRASLNRAEHGAELATIETISQQNHCLAEHVAEQRQSISYK